MRLRFLAASLLALLPSGLDAQAVDVEVVDAANGKPFGIVSVALIDRTGQISQQAIASDSLGRATVRARQAGYYRVLVRRFDYNPDTSSFIKIADGQTVAHRVQLTARPYHLAEVDIKEDVATTANVQARLFEARRRALGTGRIFTARDLDSLRITRMPEAVDATPGVSVGPARENALEWQLHASFCPNGPHHYYWNSVRMSDPNALNFLMSMDINSVTAIEIYTTSGSIPPSSTWAFRSRAW